MFFVEVVDFFFFHEIPVLCMRGLIRKLEALRKQNVDNWIEVRNRLCKLINTVKIALVDGLSK